MDNVKSRIAARFLIQEDDSYGLDVGALDSLEAFKSFDKVMFNLELELAAARSNQDGGKVLVFSNLVTTLKGANTGGYNAEHAFLDGANGGEFTTIPNPGPGWK